MILIIPSPLINNLRMDIEKTKSDFSELMKEFSWEAPTYDIYQANRDPLEKDIFNVEGDDPSEILLEN